jgi:hypothetical protein
MRPSLSYGWGRDFLLFGGLFRGNILATFFRKRRDFRNLDKHWQQSQTVGNKGEAAISGGFQSVEMRGIESRYIKPESPTPT